LIIMIKLSFFYVFLPNSYENFVDTILYGKYSISVSNVKDAMHSKDLKRKVSNSNEDELDACLVVSRGRNKERNWCFNDKEIGRIKKDYP
jgi:hypothetical protein